VKPWPGSCMRVGAAGGLDTADAGSRPEIQRGGMSALMFSVRTPGSDEIHRMEATPTSRGIRFTCTCSDGTEGRHCEHRLGLLLGDTSNLVQIDRVAVEALATMTKGSPLLRAVHMLSQAEAAAAEAELDLQRARRVIATILMG
jgi:hypothetical protein